MARAIPHSLRRRRGYSLVELMVALALGLILVASVLQVYMSGKQSHNTREGAAELFDNARFALHLLTRDIGMSGYDNGDSLLAISAATDNNAGDSITVRYRSTTDCLGHATGGIATNRYYISGTTLMCQGNGDPDPAVLTEGIENMQILYGEDTNADFTADRFVNAPDVGNWANIASVRVALLASSNSVVAGTADANTYTLLDRAPISIASTSATANFRRKVFNTTILVRNYRRN